VYYPNFQNRGKYAITLNGINEKGPSKQINKISITALIKRPLKEDTIKFISDSLFMDILNSSQPVSANVCEALTSSSRLNVYDRYLVSENGFLIMTKLLIGPFHNGKAPGRILGTFTFSGKGLLSAQDFPGNAFGTFGLPLVVFDNVTSNSTSH